VTESNISVEIRPASRPGPVKAYADVTYALPDGTIVIRGCAVVQKDGKPPFVGMPSRPGTSPGKFFRVIEIDGAVYTRLVKAVLEKFTNFEGRE
jgi:DNA-binding cell septation regulator SpoVG